MYCFPSFLYVFSFSLRIRCYINKFNPIKVQVLPVNDPFYVGRCILQVCVRAC